MSDDASICSVEDGVLYYVANKYDSNGTSYVDLYTYANGKSTRAAQDIAADYATVYEDGQLLVHTGYNSYDDKEIALIAKDGTRTVIADGVSWVRRVDKNTTLYISDNDLYSYDGKEKTRLLTDVDQMWCRDTLAGTTIDLAGTAIKIQRKGDATMAFFDEMKNRVTQRARARPRVPKSFRRSPG